MPWEISPIWKLEFDYEDGNGVCLRSDFWVCFPMNYATFCTYSVYDVFFDECWHFGNQKMPVTLWLGILELLKREMGMVQQFGADSKFQLTLTKLGVHYIGGRDQIFGYILIYLYCMLLYYVVASCPSPVVWHLRYYIDWKVLKRGHLSCLEGPSWSDGQCTHQRTLISCTFLAKS